MKKASLLVLAMTFTIICYAQDNPKQKEVGITMSNLNSFGLTFKIGKSTALWRINTLFIAGGESEEVADTTRVSFKSNGVNVQMGREWRSLVTDKFVLRYGVDFKFIYSHSERVRFDTGTFRDSENFRTTYRYGFNIVLGMNYLITDRIFIGGEHVTINHIQMIKSSPYEKVPFIEVEEILDTSFNWQKLEQSQKNHRR